MAPRSKESATLVLAVLGGIASGKSTAARLLAGPDGVVLDADVFAREAMDDPEVLARVREELLPLCPGCIGPDGRVDRGALAELVFRRPDARAALEGWIHPRVRDRIWAGLTEARARGVPRIVLDVPLLLETDALLQELPRALHRTERSLVSACDALVFVDSDPRERERRAAAARGWKAGEVARREAAQMPLDEKRSRAHFTVSNRGGLGELERDVREVLRRLGSDSAH